MAEGSHLAEARAVFAAFDAQDVEAMTDLVADDVALRLGNPPMVSGKEAFADAVRAFLGSVERFRHEIVSLWQDGDTVTAELVVHYVRLDGGEVSLPCCNVFDFDGNLVVGYRSYMDISCKSRSKTAAPERVENMIENGST